MSTEYEDVDVTSVLYNHCQWMMHLLVTKLDKCLLFI